MKRILIIDDSDVVRDGIGRLLSAEEKVTVCGEAKNGLEGIEKTLQLRPDVVLLDVSMPGINGLETARRLKAELPAINILMLSQNDASHLLPAALRAGAKGCIDKTRLYADLLTAINGL